MSLLARWAPSAPPARLAAVRVVVGSYALWYVQSRARMMQSVAGAEAAHFQPVGVVAPLPGPLPAAAFRLVLRGTQAANVAFVLGWRHAYSGPLFAGSLLWLISYRNSWSMIYHNDNVLVLHALVLGVAPAADALSLDALADRRAGRGRRRATLRVLTRVATRHRSTRAQSVRYGWPLRLMVTVSTLTYWLAGVAKLKGPLGRRWGSGESLRSQIAVDGVRKEVLGEEGAAPLAYSLYNQLWLFRMLATGSLVVELMAPLALLDRRLARAWALNAFAMHWGIRVLMRIKFRHQLTGVAFAPFLPLERAPALVVGALGVAARLARR